jgi:hypothetical protein
MPLTVTGGQVAAHAPEQVEVVLLSASNRYRLRPLASTRNLPGIPDADARSIVVLAALDDALAAAVGLLGWVVADDAAGAAVLLELEPLEQAVAARAIPPATAKAAIRFLIGCSLVTMRPGAPHRARPPDAF